MEQGAMIDPPQKLRDNPVPEPVAQSGQDIASALMALGSVNPSNFLYGQQDQQVQQPQFQIPPDKVFSPDYNAARFSETVSGINANAAQQAAEIRAMLDPKIEAENKKRADAAARIGPLAEEKKKLREEASKLKEDRLRGPNLKEGGIALALAALASLMGDDGSFTRGLLGGYMQGRDQAQQRFRQEFIDKQNSFNTLIQGKDDELSGIRATIDAANQAADDYDRSKQRGLERISDDANKRVAEAGKNKSISDQAYIDLQSQYVKLNNDLKNAQTVDQAELILRQKIALAEKLGLDPGVAPDEVKSTAGRIVGTKELRRLSNNLMNGKTSGARMLAAAQMEQIIRANPGIDEYNMENAAWMQALERLRADNPWERELLLKNKITAGTINEAIRIKQLEVKKLEADIKETIANIKYINTYKGKGKGGGSDDQAKQLSKEQASMKSSLDGLIKLQKNILSRYTLPSGQIAVDAYNDPQYQKVAAGIKSLGDRMVQLSTRNLGIAQQADNLRQQEAARKEREKQGQSGGRGGSGGMGGRILNNDGSPISGAANPYSFDSISGNGGAIVGGITGSFRK